VVRVVLGDARRAGRTGSFVLFRRPPRSGVSPGSRSAPPKLSGSGSVAFARRACHGAWVTPGTRRDLTDSGGEGQSSGRVGLRGAFDKAQRAREPDIPDAVNEWRRQRQRSRSASRRHAGPAPHQPSRGDHCREAHRRRPSFGAERDRDQIRQRFRSASPRGATPALPPTSRPVAITVAKRTADVHHSVRNATEIGSGSDHRRMRRGTRRQARPVRDHVESTFWHCSRGWDGGKAWSRQWTRRAGVSVAGGVGRRPGLDAPASGTRCGRSPRTREAPAALLLGEAYDR
jgi:hypothetical protein